MNINMNKLSALLVTIGLSLSFNTVAATITFPAELEVEGINGEHGQYGQTVEVTSGKQLIMVRYREMFHGPSADSGRFTTSNKLYLQADIKQGEYQVSLPDIHSEIAAHQFINAPQIMLVDSQGNTETKTLLTNYQMMALLIE